MGSWYATCGVSNLPIQDNDEVVLFILEGKQENVLLGADGFCYADTFFDPILPLFAKYYDYGDFSIIHDKNKDIVCEYIRNKFKNKGYICKKENVELDNLQVEEFVKLVKEGYIYKNICFDKYAPVGYMLVHRDIYEKLMNSIDKNDWEMQMVDSSYNLMMRDVKERKKDLTECFIESSQEVIDKKLAISLNYAVDFSFTKNLKDIIIKICMKEVGEEVETEILNLAYFKQIFTKLRKVWMPQSGCGSQASYDEMYVVLAEAMIEKYNKYEEECEY